MSKYTQLQQAYYQHQLIDVVMRSTKDIYTGKIWQLDQKHIILKVYSDYGLPNGYVLVTIRAIAVISSQGADLQRIQKRIQIAQQQHLWAPVDEPLAQLTSPLLPALLQHLAQQQSLVLTIGVSAYQYQQAKIKQVAGRQVNIEVYDFFDFSYNHLSETFFQDQLEALEFGGQELNQATKYFLQPHVHCLPLIIKANSYLLPSLQKLVGSQTLIMIYLNTSNSNFYVGKVTNVTPQEIALSLVDQNGYFGGYAVIRLSEVSFVSAQTDYLRLIATYRRWQQQQNTFVQPVLDAKMQFASDNLWQSAFTQLTQTKAMLRIQLRNLSTDILAYSLGASAKSVKLAIFDNFQTRSTQVKEVQYTDIARITFGYLNSYFTKAELIK
ncbi:hypothetical protein [Bombilactobacillus bombi]|uniref:hypothetical protein n=1 Tax=Bombilactobacillus bombi TaxID=1303590 RepID=UPI0015E61D70|nr:hypothetical protein [Bombilactobacillus bombi]MBA1433748.1 hypothetical protein [Bombilactobacillus bombi]